MIAMGGCGPGEHLTYLGFKYKSVTTTKAPGNGAPIPHNHYEDSYHGRNSGHAINMPVKDGEHITQVVLSTHQVKTGFFKSKKWTRISSISITTDKKNTVSCGVQTGKFVSLSNAICTDY